MIKIKDLKMPAGYLIAQLKVTNPENYKEYVTKVGEVVKKYDGEYLVRNCDYKVVEGSDKSNVSFLLKYNLLANIILIPKPSCSSNTT